jgi:signal transduction histidine kinase
MMLRPPADANGSVPVSLDFGDDVVPLLLVDDQPSNLQALETLLGSTGCRLVRAQSADEALLALLDQDFAAIVLDIQMPGMNGLELASLIKQRRRSRHVPILFLTAHMIDERDMLQGYGTGAVDYLTKPIHPEILRSKIAVFVELFRKTRALARTNEMLQREMAERERMDEALRQANQELEWRVQERTEALQEADRRKDEFLASLAHELRNPLAPIRSAVEVLRRPELGAHHRGEAQAVIVRQVEHMTRLIDDLLDVSRITRDMLVLRVQRIGLEQVMAAAIETSRPLIAEREHALHVELPAEPVHLDADPARLAQVLSNLLTNAAKYTAPGGEIRVAAEADDREVLIKVTDTGIGIEPDMLPMVFDLFVQGDRSRDRSGGGLGIGLTLARRLVMMHGGAIDVHSAGPGQGAVFSVRLPVAPASAEAGRPAMLLSEAELPHALRVLVIDDNEDAADMLATLLTAWGQQARVARDGLAALEAAHDFRPDVVLLDIGLPHLDGYEVARRIRQQAWGQHMVLAAVTGWGQDSDRQRSQEAGFDHHLVKPVDPEALRTLLATKRPIDASDAGVAPEA